jgi:hypothetical protein
MSAKKVFLVGLVCTILAMALPGVALADEGKGKLPNLLEVISPSVQALLQALAMAMVPYLAYHAKRLIDEAVRRAQQELTAEQYGMAEIIVSNLVHAAEQIYERGEGDAKKAYVLKQAQEFLANYGLKLDLSQLEALIESLVHSELKAPAGDSSIRFAHSE